MGELCVTQWQGSAPLLPEYFLDDYDENNKIVYEFNGCFSHFCPLSYDKDTKSSLDNLPLWYKSNNTVKETSLTGSSLSSGLNVGLSVEQTFENWSWYTTIRQ